jgi:hypothetical protein
MSGCSCAQAYAECAHNLRDGLEARIAARIERLVQAGPVMPVSFESFIMPHARATTPSV